MDDDIETLRATESACLARFAEKQRALRAENQGMSPHVLRAKAASLLPKTLEKYLWCTSRLKFAGLALKEWR
jgi:hypothetical protein